MSVPCEMTRPLTLKYVFALGLLGSLAVVNFLILRTEIRDSQTIASIAHQSGIQRMLLYQSGMIAERLIFATSAADRSQYRKELTSTIKSLETAHFDLMLPGSTGLPDSPHEPAPDDEVRTIYEDAPWLLDTEMRNYLLHLRGIVKTPDDELHSDNAHFKYVRDSETIDKILHSLDGVVDIYDRRSQAKTGQLRLLAVWSLVSTLAVLVLDGWFVFRPMVRRVREDVAELHRLNETLEERVAMRTAEAERRAELLGKSESALRDSEALYRSLVDHLPMCVLRKDCDGRFTFANESFQRLVRLDLNQLVGMTDDDIYPPALAAKYRADDRRVMVTQCTFQDVEEHTAPDGRQMYVEVLKTPLRDEMETVIGTQTVFWDVTQRKEAEQRAVHAERLAAIGKMVAGVAHESRNALQQIQACSQLLDWELDGDAAKQDLISDLQKAHDRLHRLFDELRGYASPLKLAKRPCNVSKILHQAWDALKPQHNGRDAALYEQKTDTTLQCRADPFQLEQLFRNLLENALAACRDPVTIEVSYDEMMLNDRKALRIAVKDNGPGLSAEQQENIFEPFFTTKTQGSGLGMAIVKQIVEAHGGTIEAGSNGKQGAEIQFSLPGS